MNPTWRVQPLPPPSHPTHSWFTHLQRVRPACPPSPTHLPCHLHMPFIPPPGTTPPAPIPPPGTYTLSRPRRMPTHPPPPTPAWHLPSPHPRLAPTLPPPPPGTYPPPTPTWHLPSPLFSRVTHTHALALFLESLTHALTLFSRVTHTRPYLAPYHPNPPTYLAPYPPTPPTYLAPYHPNPPTYLAPYHPNPPPTWHHTTLTPPPTWHLLPPHQLLPTSTHLAPPP